MSIPIQAEVGVVFFLGNRGDLASFSANAGWQPIHHFNEPRPRFSARAWVQARGERIDQRVCLHMRSSRCCAESQIFAKFSSIFTMNHLSFVACYLRNSFFKSSCKY